jgi:hypothetical protein
MSMTNSSLFKEITHGSQTSGNEEGGCQETGGESAAGSESATIYETHSDCN